MFKKMFVCLAVFCLLAGCGDSGNDQDVIPEPSAAMEFNPQDFADIVGLIHKQNTDAWTLIADITETLFKSVRQKPQNQIKTPTTSQGWIEINFSNIKQANGKIVSADYDVNLDDFADWGEFAYNQEIWGRLINTDYLQYYLNFRNIKKPINLDGRMLITFDTARQRTIVFEAFDLGQFYNITGTLQISDNGTAQVLTLTDLAVREFTLNAILEIILDANGLITLNTVETGMVNGHYFTITGYPGGCTIQSWSPAEPQNIAIHCVEP
jgi:hypothetical protein